MHSGDCLAVGSFDTAATFDSLHLTSAGGSDAFIVRLRDDAAGISVKKPLALEVALYPNPASQVLHLDPGSSPVDVSIVDLDGIIRCKIASAAHSIDIRDLPDGTYFLRSRDKTMKFVKIAR